MNTCKSRPLLWALGLSLAFSPLVLESKPGQRPGNGNGETDNSDNPSNGDTIKDDSDGDTPSIKPIESDTPPEDTGSDPQKLPQDLPSENISITQDEKGIQRIQIEIDGETLSVDADIFGKPLETINQQDIANLQEQVERGRAIYAKIIGNEKENLTPNELADLMWAMHVLAEKKIGSSFMKGAFTMNDPEGKIAKAIAQSPTAYTMGSSHLKDEKKGISRIDLYPTKDSPEKFLLPYGFRSVLTHPYTISSQPNQSYVYFKMETRSAKPGLEGIKHILNYTNRSDQGKSTRREDLSSGTLKLREHVLSLLQEEPENPVFQGALELFNGGRIYQMVETIPLIQAQITTQIEERMTGIEDRIKAEVKRVEDSKTPTLMNIKAHKEKERLLGLEKTLNLLSDAINSYGDDVDIRLGDEVILNDQDLLPSS